MPRPHSWFSVLVACALLAAVAGCGGGSSGQAPSSLSEMDYYTGSPGSDVISSMLNQCGRQAGVTIHRAALEREQMFSKVLQEAPSHSLPNILMLDNPDLQQVASTGALSPLSTFGFSPSGYYGSILSAGSYKGKVYALSLGVNSIALFYNKDMLAAAHIDPPRTWDQLVSDARALTSGSTYGLAFSAPATEEGTWQFEPFFWSNGASLKKVSSPQAVQALQLWTKLVQDGSASRSVVSWTQADVANQFIAGHAAMVVNGPWNFSVFDTGPHYGIVPIPTPRAGKRPVVPLGGEVWTVPASNTATEQKAWQVLSCMQQPSNMLRWDKNGYVPPKPAVASQLEKQLPNIGAFVDEIPAAKARTAELGPAYPKVSQALWTAIQGALIGSQSPQQALDQAQQAVSQATTG
jgi:multiple sugar transport system substrate-binding protein